MWRSHNRGRRKLRWVADWTFYVHPGIKLAIEARDDLRRVTLVRPF